MIPRAQLIAAKAQRRCSPRDIQSIFRSQVSKFEKEQGAKDQGGSQKKSGNLGHGVWGVWGGRPRLANFRPKLVHWFLILENKSKVEVSAARKLTGTSQERINPCQWLPIHDLFLLGNDHGRFGTWSIIWMNHQAAVVA